MMKKQQALERVTKVTRSPYQMIFWDWNGTLLDDRDYAIAVRNRVFPGFGLPRLESVAEYFSQFTFPVREYYTRAGVTDEAFVEVANAWMAEYVRGAENIPLHGDALAAMEAFQSAGLLQVVLSASDLGILSRQLSHYGMQDSFAAVLGLSHIYATSKQAIGQAYLSECGVPPAACLLLGDTLHDADVAREMGIGCILVARGHQSHEALKTAEVPVCGSLLEAVALCLGATQAP